MTAEKTKIDIAKLVRLTQITLDGLPENLPTRQRGMSGPVGPQEWTRPGKALAEPTEQTVENALGCRQPVTRNGVGIVKELETDQFLFIFRENPAHQEISMTIRNIHPKEIGKIAEEITSWAQTCRITE